MNLKDAKTGFEDMKILLNMTDELEKKKFSSEKDIDEAKQKLEYIKSRLLKISSDNDRILKFASESITK